MKRDSVTTAPLLHMALVLTSLSLSVWAARGQQATQAVTKPLLPSLDVTLGRTSLIIPSLLSYLALAHSIICATEKWSSAPARIPEYYHLSSLNPQIIYLRKII